MKYRKKPVVVDAIQYTGDNKKEISEFTEGKADMWIKLNQVGIPTLKGKYNVFPTNWIIKDVAGNLHLVGDDIFKEAYEPAYCEDC